MAQCVWRLPGLTYGLHRAALHWSNKTKMPNPDDKPHQPTQAEFEEFLGSVNIRQLAKPLWIWIQNAYAKAAD
jgi:hypothetical protein